MHANKREDIKAVYSPVTSLRRSGLRNVHTGDTIADQGTTPWCSKSMQFPEPVISVVIEPKTKADQEKLGVALAKLTQEDPTFRSLYRSPRPPRPSSAGWASFISRSWSIDCYVSSASPLAWANPRSPTRRPFVRAAKAEGRYVRQTGGRGQYGHVWLEVTPESGR